jgi:hypothetical protein
LVLPESLFYVGIDWATEMHAVCELDSAGKIKSQFMIAHTADGLADQLRRLGKLPADPMDVPVAIERPDGRLVDALLEAGHPVMPVSPNALKTWREGQVLSGAKSDAGDAAVIATRRRAAAPTAIRPGRTNENTLIEAVGDAVLALVTVVKALGAARKDLHRSPTSGSTRTGRSPPRCQGRVRSTPPRCSPRGATPGQPTTDPTPWLPWPA